MEDAARTMTTWGAEIVAPQRSRLSSLLVPPSAPSTLATTSSAASFAWAWTGKVTAS